jgi:hypothetical protein
MRVKEYVLLLPLPAILFPQAIPLISHEYPALYRPKIAKNNTSSKLTLFFPKLLPQANITIEDVI